MKLLLKIICAYFVIKYKYIVDNLINIGVGSTWVMFAEHMTTGDLDVF